MALMVEVLKVRLTVFLRGHRESHILLLQFLIRLLEEADVVDRLSQYRRLIQLKANK